MKGDDGVASIEILNIYIRQLTQYKYYYLLARTISSALSPLQAIPIPNHPNDHRHVVPEQ